MLDFIDRFAAPRYRADPQLRCASIWVGTVSSKKALNAYLSPGSPERAQFVKDAGDDWYDHDFLDAQKQRSQRPAAEVITELAQSYDLPAEATSRLIDASRERGLIEAIDQIGRALALASHAHVERPVLVERKAALGLVELHGADPDIEHHRVRLFVSGQRVQRRKPAGNEAEAGAVEVREPLGERGNRRIPVDGDNIGARREQRFTVAARPERAVDHQRALQRSERRADFGEQHRLVGHLCRARNGMICSAHDAD